MNRGEIWLADLGYIGKTRPVMILSVPPGDEDRALVTYVIRERLSWSIKGIRVRTGIKCALKC